MDFLGKIVGFWIFGKDFIFLDFLGKILGFGVFFYIFGFRLDGLDILIGTPGKLPDWGTNLRCFDSFYLQIILKRIKLTN